MAANSNAIVTDGIVTGAIMGPDEIVFQVINSCGSSSTHHNVYVDSLPIAPVLSGRSLVCMSIPDTIIAFPWGGSWTLTNSSLDSTGYGIFTGVSEGRDTATYTISNSCGSSSKSFVLNILTSAGCDSANGVAETEFERQVSISPNPSDGFFEISVSGQQTQVFNRLIITDVLGKVVLNQIIKFDSYGKAMISLRDCTPGAYFVNLRSDNFVYNSKIIIW